MKLSPVKQQVITIEKPYGGFAPQKNKPGQGLAYPVEVPDNKYAYPQYSLASFINLYRANFEGDIAPGECFNYQLSDALGIVNALPVAATVLDQNYAILTNNRVVQFTSSAVGQVNYWDTSAHGGHSAGSPGNNNDIISSIDLKVTPNIAYLFYTWEDDTDADIGIITHQVGSGGYTQTDDWFSNLSGGAALSKSVPRKLMIGTDGNLYSTNGQYIAQAVLVNTAYASATANATKLNLGNGYVARSYIPYQNFMVIIGDKPDQNFATAQYPRVRVWFWDYASANPNYVFDLNDFTACTISLDANGTLTAITKGKDSQTTEWVYNGSSFQIKYQASTTTIGSPLHNQIDLWNGYLHFVGNLAINQWDGTGFHQPLGTIITNNPPNPVVAFGFLKNIDTLYAGAQITRNQSGYASVYGIFSLVNLTNDTTYTPNAVFYDRLHVLGYRGRVVAVRLFFSQFGTGASFKISLYEGYDTSTDLLNRTISYSGGNKYNSVVIPTNIVLDSLYPIFTFNHSSSTATAAILRKAEIVVEPTDFKL